MSHYAAKTFLILSVILFGISTVKCQKADEGKNRPSIEFSVGNCLGEDYGDFQPLGWSRDGKFAWIHTWPTLESDFETFEYIIQNMVTDKILWHDSFETEMTQPDSINERQRNQNSAWQDFEQQMQIHGIEKLELAWHGLPIVADSENIEAVLIKQGAMSEMGEALKEASIFIRSPERGPKRVFHKNFVSDYPELQDLALAGYIASPFEDRVALVVARRGFGFEGVCDIKYMVIGAHLQAGFRR